MISHKLEVSKAAICKWVEAKCTKEESYQDFLKWKGGGMFLGHSLKTITLLIIIKWI